MIQLTVYKPDGQKLYPNVTDLRTEDGVLKFDTRTNPSDNAYSTVRTNLPFIVEEAFPAR